MIIGIELMQEELFRSRKKNSLGVVKAEGKFNGMFETRLVKGFYIACGQLVGVGLARLSRLSPLQANNDTLRV